MYNIATMRINNKVENHLLQRNRATLHYAAGQKLSNVGHWDKVSYWKQIARHKIFVIRAGAWPTL